jgi:hypothetical protein
MDIVGRSRQQPAPPEEAIKGIVEDVKEAQAESARGGAKAAEQRQKANQ